MYEYADYFDKEKRKEPYGSYAEELDDYLRLLDMMLEGYLRFKGLSKEQKLFSRGLVITESEMEAYFEMPPYFREADIWDPVMAMSCAEGFDYISDRVKATITEKTSEEYKEKLPIEYLKNKLSLDRTGILSLILVIAPELDRKYERIFGFLQDDIKAKRPTIGLVYALLRRMTPREVSGRFIPEIEEPEIYSQVFLRGITDFSLDTVLTVDPIIRKMIVGQYKKESIKRFPFWEYTEKEDIPLFFEEAGEATEGILFSGNQPFCYLENEDWETVAHIIYKLCEKRKERLYILDINLFSGLSADKRRECISALYLRMILDDGNLLVNFEPENIPEGQTKNDFRLDEALSELTGLCRGKCIILAGQGKEPGSLAAYGIPSLYIAPPDVELRIGIWEHFIASDDVAISEDVEIADLADCYDIPYSMIRKVCSHVTESAKLLKDAKIDRELIRESLRQINQVNFSHLATYVRTVYTWEDLTIDPKEMGVLRTACDRYRMRNRIGDKWGLKKKNAYGNGVSILLYGPPGTGKTMAAQVIARELSLPLYRVDVSQIFSKYIGETEKNLRAVFEAASKANVILFFDEADALFSKRTEISQSNDKYSNSETAYLLQKIEEYDGLTILATNYYNNFDSAFVRRITYSAHMDRPGEDARYELWTSILPPETEIRKDIDFHFLARQFELSGSNIKAILYSAAYMAGAEEKPVGPEHIVRAIQYEFQKTGRLIDRGEFGMYGVYLI